QAKALTLQGALEGLHVLPDDGDGPPIVAQNIIEPAEVKVGLDLQREIPEGLADGEGTLPRLKGVVQVLSHIEVVGQKGKDPPQPTLIVQGHCEAFRVAEGAEDPLLLSKRKEPIAPVKSKR